MFGRNILCILVAASFSRDIILSVFSLFLSCRMLTSVTWRGCKANFSQLELYLMPAHFLWESNYTRLSHAWRKYCYYSNFSIIWKIMQFTKKKRQKKSISIILNWSLNNESTKNKFAGIIKASFRAAIKTTAIGNRHREINPNLN